MAKFYQHFSPEDSIMGKVVKLKYIDDISDDDFILYHFSDGTKCNKEFIGAVNVDDPIMQRCVMVEVLSPVQKWTLEKKTIDLQETIRVYNQKDEQWYEAPGETININNGENMAKAKDGSVRIEATPPQLPRRWTVEPEEDYLLSLHPELETDGVAAPAKAPVKKVETPKKKEEPVPEVLKVTAEKPVELDQDVKEEFDFDDDLEPMPLEDDNANGVDTIYVPKLKDYISVDLGNEVILMSKKEFIRLITGPRQPAVAQPVPEVRTVRADEEVIKNENILIKSMIDMSKKKVCEVGMDVVLELPPKEVYDTIKNSYTEELASEFVKSLTARIPLDKLLQSLSEGLAEYYSAGNVASADEV